MLLAFVGAVNHTMTIKRVGLIGWPVEHSVSPAMHNAAFRALGLTEWQYDLLPTPNSELAQRIDTLVENSFVGCNVTIPHKKAIMPLLDRVVLAARSIDAVNTIVVEDGQLVGHNTDSAGFILDLESHRVQIYGRHALILGAGGAAHAAALGLANRGVEVTVINRHEQAAWDLRNAIRRGISSMLKINVQSLSALPKVAPSANLIVNCTSVGMWPNTDASIWPNDIPFAKDTVVYDMVYRPRETAFLKQAKAAGCVAIGGLGMLIHQGALAFELWTEQPAPIDIMATAAENALIQHNE